MKVKIDSSLLPHPVVVYDTDQTGTSDRFRSIFEPTVIAEQNGTVILAVGQTQSRTLFYGLIIAVILFTLFLFRRF